MLGVIHRTVLKRGAPQFQNWFFSDTRPKHSYPTRLRTGLHSKQLYDYIDAAQSELLRRSGLGLTQVYNKLPQKAVDFSTVKGFQSWLQEEVKKAAKNNKENWQNLWKRR